nr:MAG TPA: hypothetical protein [Caudoviricetes sp.]
MSLLIAKLLNSSFFLLSFYFKGFNPFDKIIIYKNTLIFKKYP